MRFLLTAYEYPQFMYWLRKQHPRAMRQPYSEQLRNRQSYGFLWSDFYSKNLRSLGHEAQEVVPGNSDLQLTWAREHGLRIGGRWRMRTRRGVIPWLDWQRDSDWESRIFLEQVRAYRPDVLLVRDISTVTPPLLAEVRQYVRLIVGQHASQFDEARDFRGYDLILSSLPNFVDHFRARGLKSEYMRLGFEPTVLEHVKVRPKSIDASFVGKLGGDHATRAPFVERLVAETCVQLWGTAHEGLSETARHRFGGPAWGIDMYQVLSDSRITVNQHESWAGNHANNLRLYEATGVGTLLVTDAKSDLSALFKPHQEVAVYDSVEECGELINHFLAHPAEGAAIAAAGRRRTLSEHTYALRMQELVDLLRRYL
jgi:spore maturation protein CgeB